VSVKTILVAHQSPAIRDRFAAALAEARHASVTAPTEARVRAILSGRQARIDLALIDLGLSEAPMDLVAEVRRAGERLVPVVVFAGSLGSAAQVVELTTLGVTAFMNEHAPAAQIMAALVPHLFPDNFNRRANTRVRVAVPISFETNGIISAARTQDMGRGGVAIRTLDPLPLGTVVELTFRLPGSPRDVTAAGRVSWSDRRVGMGVQFERLTADAQRLLGAFVENG
jgi:uncharacterized protein (TIGR02266 family)